MNIKWQEVFILILTILVVSLYQSNETLRKSNTGLETENTVATEEKVEMNKEKKVELEIKNKVENIGEIYQIEYIELKKLTLEKVWGNSGKYSNQKVTMRDDWYYYPSKEILENIIENDDTDKNV